MSETVSPDFERLHDGHFSDQVAKTNRTEATGKKLTYCWPRDAALWLKKHEFGH